MGYGHRLLPGESFNGRITEETADSLLRADLKQKCAAFRDFGRDSLLLGVLAYNIGNTGCWDMENARRAAWSKNWKGRPGYTERVCLFPKMAGAGNPLDRTKTESGIRPAVQQDEKNLYIRKR